MAAPSRALAAAVHRPFAEQVVAFLGRLDGLRVLDIDAGDGELAARLRVAGAAIDVVDAGALTAAVPRAAHSGGYDVCASVLGVANDSELRPALTAIRRTASRGAVVVWEDGARHATAVWHAYRDSQAAPDGISLDALGPRPAVRPPSGWRRSPIDDVARFDGVAQLHAAVLGGSPGRASPAVLEALERRLATQVAADGTLRIPIRAALLHSL